MAELWREIRYGFRLLTRSPAFAVVVVLVLAVGAGTNIAIFNVVDAVVLKTLPVKDPQQLVILRWHSRTPLPSNIMEEQAREGEAFSYPTYNHLQSRANGLASIFGFANASLVTNYVDVKVNGRGALAHGTVVTGDYFSALGVRPTVGRLISPDDEKPDATPVVDISYNFWTREFGRATAAIGQTIFIDGSPFTVVGVTPPEFSGVEPGKKPDFWEPIGQWDGMKRRMADMFTDRSSQRFWWLTLMARLGRGLSREQVRTRLEILFRQSLSAELDPGVNPYELPRLDFDPGNRGTSLLRRVFSHSLVLWMVIAALGLLVACSNMAMLISVRARIREPEMAVRLALGASRLRLIRQLLIETLILAGIAALLGATFAFWCSRTIMALMSSLVESLGLEIDQGTPDLWVLCFSVGAAVLTGVLCSLAPARLAIRADLAPLLKESGTAAISRGGRRRMSTGDALVTCQVALSLVVIIGAGLFLRTIENLENANLGFNPRNVLVFGVDAARDRYRGETLAELYERILQRMQTLPGVEAASSSVMPLISPWIENVAVTIYGDGHTANRTSMVPTNIVGPDFFRTMGIRLLLGRELSWVDMHSAQKVAVVSESFALQFLPGGDAIGSRFNFGATVSAGDVFTIVGVAEDVKYRGAMGGVPLPMVYIPYSQNVGLLAIAFDGMHFEVRTRGAPAALVHTVRNTVDAIDPGLPLKNVESQVEQIDSSLAEQRLVAYLSGFLGLFVLLLAGVSIYGIQSYTMTQRTHEIGVRMALGASRGQILRWAWHRSLLMGAVGVGIGVTGASFATRLIASQLFGVRSLDPTTVASASVVLIAAVALGGLIPAVRASSIDPAAALHEK